MLKDLHAHWMVTAGFELAYIGKSFPNIKNTLDHTTLVKGLTARPKAPLTTPPYTGPGCNSTHQKKRK